MYFILASVHNIIFVVIWYVYHCVFIINCGFMLTLEMMVCVCVYFQLDASHLVNDKFKWIATNTQIGKIQKLYTTHSLCSGKLIVNQKKIYLFPFPAFSQI